MTSFISAPRRCFTRCSPRTQAIASATLLLPQPFGPTTPVMPSPVKMRSMWSAKDLKPVISRRLSLNIGICRLMRGVTPKLASKDDLRVCNYKEMRTTCQQVPQLTNSKWREGRNLLDFATGGLAVQRLRCDTNVTGIYRRGFSLAGPQHVHSGDRFAGRLSNVQ